MVAASILPVCIHNRELYFLFGKENRLEDSAKGWSDFGGRVENDESIYQGALREGAEEMTGFLGNEHELKKEFVIVEVIIEYHIINIMYICFIYLMNQN